MANEWQSLAFQVAFCCFCGPYLSGCWDVVLYAAVQRRLTAGACRNIISDYLDHEKLLCGNYLRKE